MPETNLQIKEVVVWSQANCSACDTTKKLLDQLGIPYRVIAIDSVENKQLFFTTFPSARSVPQIVVDGRWVGGLQDFRKFINDNNKAFKVV
jgi:glutaredoxin 3